MRVPARAAEAELREKGSVFLAFVRPVEDRGEAEGLVEEIRARHADASHCCFAWRLGRAPEERSSDAGEPMGTAGMPMLQVLRGAGLTQVIAVVVRWFGGVKLGKGGLARAYAGAVRLALEGLPVVEKLERVEVSLRLPYEKIGAVKRLLRPPEVELVAEEYGAEARLVLAVTDGRRQALLAALADLGLEPTPDLR